ncbi:hypothetical protein [Naasia aerilata]|uniref:Uncharacterized protein n=1 Tax=Naasia aerilata TaxID=1162966 RepID=A0ABN6XMT7_9MICO|nr:hypothetical protein [Naasia aerilata]BDZ44930.1 hypothetical protein GCM10025866_08390 [Naasia aerilata]
MATVPPADRTSSSLDPRYDPMYQRGYAGGAASTQRRSEVRSAVPVEVPDALGTDDIGSELGARNLAAPAEAVPPAAKPWLGVGVLWITSAALVVLGLFLYFAFGPTGYGADWSVSTTDGSLRFADGRTVEQVLATQLVVTVAPYLVVLGVASAVATLFLQVTRSQRGTR